MLASVAECDESGEVLDEAVAVDFEGPQLKAIGPAGSARDRIETGSAADFAPVPAPFADGDAKPVAIWLKGIAR